MISANSKNNRLIRLTDERMSHIMRNHPETKNCIAWILETIENPNFIIAGDFGELLAVKLYDKTPVSQDKYLIVVYKETGKLDGFILTAYFSRSINNTRRIVWKP
jgi:Txe/YoeB family toxin of Txe-Axe toxin-antitoxin module